MEGINKPEKTKESLEITPSNQEQNENNEITPDEIELQTWLAKQTLEFRKEMLAGINNLEFGNLSDKEVLEAQQETNVVNKLQELTDRIKIKSWEFQDKIALVFEKNFKPKLHQHKTEIESRVAKDHLKQDLNKENLYLRSEALYSKIEENGLKSLSNEDVDFLIQQGGASYMMNSLDKVPENLRQNLLLRLVDEGYEKELFEKYGMNLPKEVLVNLSPETIFKENNFFALNEDIQKYIITPISLKVMFINPLIEILPKMNAEMQNYAFEKIATGPNDYRLVMTQNKLEHLSPENKNLLEELRQRHYYLADGYENKKNEEVDKKYKGEKNKSSRKKSNKSDPYKVSNSVYKATNSILDVAFGKKSSGLKKLVAYKLDPVNKVSRLRDFFK